MALNKPWGVRLLFLSLLILVSMLYEIRQCWWIPMTSTTTPKSSPYIFLHSRFILIFILTIVHYRRLVTNDHAVLSSFLVCEQTGQTSHDYDSSIYSCFFHAHRLPSTGLPLFFSFFFSPFLFSFASVVTTWNSITSSQQRLSFRRSSLPLDIRSYFSSMSEPDLCHGGGKLGLILNVLVVMLLIKKHHGRDPRKYYELKDYELDIYIHH